MEETRAETARPSRAARIGLVVLLSVVPWSLATLSLLRENATIDEVVHLPAGLSYWQTGDFRMYPHNPPLVKLIAAVPVLMAGPRTEELYERPWWAAANKAGFAHEFALLNADRYFDLLARGRLVMPWIGVIGGLVVFAWSRRLYGDWGGLLSLALWAFCPNILAHTRLITTDVGATVAGFGATFAFWSYARRPTWGRAVLAGVLLGVAQLTKFSLLLLYGLWPVLWLIQELGANGFEGRWRRVGRALAQGLALVAISVVVIDCGYGFSKLGRPLGSFEFTSRTMTVDQVPPIAARRVGNADGPPLHEGLLQYRANRFRGTWLGGLPSPLPEAYLTGFDEQKLEAEGIPRKAVLFADDPRARSAEGDQTRGYPVYLDGELRSESWWYYYFAALAYKVPEGTWAIVLGSFLVLAFSPKARASWVDELSLLLIPVVLILVMSFATNIALGLRYVLPIAPYVFVSAGKLARWAETRARPRLAAGLVGACLLATAAATAGIHPHYLAHFNWLSGGPKRGSEHLIDSNLDWGQDLVGLKAWLDEHAPGERVGIAYFGQINPEIFRQAGGRLDWYLPPARPGGWARVPPPRYRGRGLSTPPGPGLYAISATLMRGLPWRVYDSPLAGADPTSWAPFEAGRNAFSYFQTLEPEDSIGHSILIYRVTPEQAERLARIWSDEGR